MYLGVRLITERIYVYIYICNKVPSCLTSDSSYFFAFHWAKAIIKAFLDKKVGAFLKALHPGFRV